MVDLGKEAGDYFIIREYVSGDPGGSFFTPGMPRRGDSPAAAFGYSRIRTAESHAPPGERKR
jgi:hypothetical protein